MLDPCANLGFAKDVKPERAVVPIQDVVAVTLTWDGPHLDPSLIERIDPIASTLDEPAKVIALRAPFVVRRNLPSFVGVLDHLGQFGEGKVAESPEAEDVSESRASTSMDPNFAVIEDQL